MFKPKSKIDPQTDQQEKLIEIGTHLQQLRIEKGMSLETVARKTLIQIRLLKAIEAGNLKDLPEPIYIRGLIKQFGDTLGSNGTELAQSFPAYVEIKQRKSAWAIGLPSFQLRPFHLYLLYIAIVVFSVRAISHVIERSALEVNPQPQPQSVASTPKSTSSPAQEPAAQPVAQPIPPASQAPAQPVVVKIQMKDRSWIKVVADGKTTFEGILPQGSNRTWTAKEQLTIRTGNAGGVLVTFNQEEAKQLGKPGQIQEITYQANNDGGIR